jgi:hypothetical protein
MTNNDIIIVIIIYLVVIFICYELHSWFQHFNFLLNCFLFLYKQIKESVIQYAEIRKIF